jgi:MFS family permease
MTAALLPPARAARLIHALFVIQLISMGAMEMSGPFWPVHLKTHSTSALEFGIASVAVYIGPMLGIMLTAAFWGRVGDRFGHKLMMVRALLGLSLTQLALAFATDVWMILALRCIQGACAGYIAPAQTYGVSVESPLRRARLFAYLQVSTNLGSLVGAVAGGLILDHATFFWINLIAAVLCAGCALMVALMLPDVRTVKPATSDAAAPARTSLWKSPPIPGLLAVIGLLLVSRTITQTPFSLYVDTVFRVGNWLVGLCYGLQALGFVVSASLWARHFEDKPLAEALRRITCVALACAALTLVGATTPVLMSLVSRAAGAQRQGHTLGAAQSVTQVSSITGIALGGWLSQAAGLQYTYFFVAVAYALSVAGILAVRREDGIAARAEAPAGQS